MLPFLADENIPTALVRALRIRVPGIDIVRTHDVNLDGKSDPEILAWAAEHQRIVLTRDVNTMTKHAFRRAERDLPMPGLVVLRPAVSTEELITAIELIARCSREGEWEKQILYVPF